MKKFTIGKTEDNTNLHIDIDILLRTRMLIQANSGGGKSYVLRRILEQSHGKVQQIVIDLEGEFSTLREQYDYILIGKGGELMPSVRYAGEIAEKVLELGLSAIIDLYELKHHDRIHFVKLFLEAMINVRKELWRPCLIIIDEAHQYAPEKGESEALSAVIDICTRGRKRSFCAILATQRISKLHKDAAAECNNKLIGRAGLDIDMKRAAEELGFTSKEDMLSLRTLQPGEFYAFGPAIAPIITKIKAGKVETTHPDIGSKSVLTPPPPKDKVKQVLNQLASLPQEAEEKILSLTEAKKKIRDLEAQIKKFKMTPAQVPVDESVIKRAEERGRNEAFKGIKQYVTSIEKLLKDVHHRAELLENLTDEIPALNMDITIKQETPIPNKRTEVTRTHTSNRKVEQSNIQTDNGEIKLKAGERRMLQASVRWHPETISYAQLKTQAGIGHPDTFGVYKNRLIAFGFLEQKGDYFIATDSGIDHIGGDIQSPTSTREVLEIWLPHFKAGERRILEYLVSLKGESISPSDLMTECNIQHPDTFGVYKNRLKAAHLIIENSGMVAANKETLFL